MRSRPIVDESDEDGPVGSSRDWFGGGQRMFGLAFKTGG